MSHSLIAIPRNLFDQQSKWKSYKLTTLQLYTKKRKSTQIQCHFTPSLTGNCKEIQNKTCKRLISTFFFFYDLCSKTFCWSFYAVYAFHILLLLLPPASFFILLPAQITWLCFYSMLSSSSFVLSWQEDRISTIQKMLQMRYACMYVMYFYSWVLNADSASTYNNQ